MSATDFLPSTVIARQLALQGAAIVLVLSVAWPWFATRGEELPWPATAFAIGGGALLLATLVKAPWRWRVFHAAFVPLAWAGAQLPIDPIWVFALVVVLLVGYRFLLARLEPAVPTGEDEAAALGKLCADRPRLRFAQLGAGSGEVVIALARARPESLFTGIEASRLALRFARLRSQRVDNCSWIAASPMRADLSRYDVVFAALPAEQLVELWPKVVGEMAPGSLFVSCIPVPEVAASELVAVGGSGEDEENDALTAAGQFYCYRR